MFVELESTDAFISINVPGGNGGFSVPKNSLIPIGGKNENSNRPIAKE